MSESSSTSKGPVVAKILIDLSEFLSLKKAKRIQDRQEHQLSKTYEKRVLNHPVEEKTNETDEEEDLSRAVPPVQVGNGIDFKNLILEAIAEGFKAVVDNKISSHIPQTGGSLASLASNTFSTINDLAPPPLQNILNETEPPEEGTKHLIKSDLNDGGDESNLLDKIPSKFRARGKQLLLAFNENPNSFSWNVDGVIFIDGDSLPLSNIFTLLPELFKYKPNKETPGFYEVVNYLANMGLGHLINKNILKGLRRTAPIENHKELLKYVKENPWYFLGM